jgi:H+-translocating NAD(P) transhydrogenase subunit alpha
MKIAIPKEQRPDEARVAASPETVKKLVNLGFEVAVEAGAGLGAAMTDAAYEKAGATIAADATVAAGGADVIARVRRPLPDESKGLKPGALVICIMDPFRAGDELVPLAESGATAFAMDLIPRITRAQSMDVLSSQSNLAGYKAVLDAAAVYGSAFPMMMTAAGTVPPAKALVMGAGVAGLQAIATAKRLGAVVSATDVRPAAKEQVESLGGKFVAVEDDEFRQAATPRR